MTNPIGNNNGDFIIDQHEGFKGKIEQLNADLKKALEELKKDPSDPSKLATYQAVSSSYQIARQAQSSVVKMYKEVANSIISNFR